MRKWLKRALIFIPLILLVGLILMTSCMTFRQSDSKTHEYFNKKGRTVEIRRIDFEGKEIRYIESKNKDINNTLIVFVHGAPGSSQDMLYYLADSSLLKNARMISYDRLGYGYSDYGHAEISIERQADLINALLDDIPEERVILVGHSFGGPIAAKAAVHNSKISSILMLAPVNDPYNEKIFKVSYFGKWKLTRWMLSKALKVATDEKFSHEQELLKIKDDWKALNIPVVHVHGGKDWIAPIENVEWSKNNIPLENLKIVRDEELDHFIPFKNQDLVVNELLQLLKMP